MNNPSLAERQEELRLRHTAQNVVNDAKPRLPEFLSVMDIAKSLKLSYNTVKRLVKDDPEVLKLNNPETRRKRAYCTYRIPVSSYTRLIEKLKAGN